MVKGLTALAQLIAEKSPAAIWATKYTIIHDYRKRI